MSVYLWYGEGIIAAFTGIITFPIARVVSTAIHNRATRRAKARLSREEAERVYDQLSPEERAVVGVFCRGGWLRRHMATNESGRGCYKRGGVAS